MPVFSSYSEIQKAIQLFNKHAYNAGLDFKVYTSDEHCLYIQASFDFGYYVNVDIECREVFYTNIGPKDFWPDMWHADQMFLLTPDELDELVDFKDLEINSEKPYFGITFNIAGKDNYFLHGAVICTSLYISWRYPDKNNEYI